ncbi:MAG: tetratricopeptide repeat protein [Sphingomonadaceae bacterium]|nr:tetratricopeptide repeat protein [Sphingomonadaceae bacterium]
MKRAWSLVLLAGVGAAMSADATAQSGASVESRVTVLEKEMHAVQRKVFPGGAGAELTPEVQAPPPNAGPGGIPATSPVADLTARVDSLERQLAQLTGQVEQDGYTVRQVQDQMAKLKSDYDYRLSALEKGSAGGSGANPDGNLPPPPPSKRGAPPPPADTGADNAAPAAATGDPAEDAYMAGYKLWTQKKYPEAEAALKAVVAKYPDSKRASYAQNLLGRSYLDEGKPGLAADAFYSNYKKMPRGERAPDSLYYLGQSLMQLKKPADACKVYGELGDVYGAKLTEPLKSRVAQAKTDAKCGG